MKVFLALIILHSSYLLAVSERFKKTEFYSTPVAEICLEKLNIKEDKKLDKPVFKKKSRGKYSLSLNPKQVLYFNSLSEEEKKILLKIVSLGIYEDDVNISNYMPEQYSLIYKGGGAFRLETIAIIPISYEQAHPVISDFDSYGDWVLRDINTRRDGRSGKYFLDIDSLRKFRKSTDDYFAAVITLRRFFRGKYRIELKIKDGTDKRPVPYFSLETEKPTQLAKSVSGRFSFIMLPGFDYFVSYFVGSTELNWAYYRLLPIRLVRSQVVERIYTILENVQHRVQDEQSSVNITAKTKESE